MGQSIKKKPVYALGSLLENYLKTYGRAVTVPVTYERLSSFHVAAPLYDEHGEDTYWQSVAYTPEEQSHLYRDLCEIYSILKTGRSSKWMSHLYVDRIDYCTFGNSKPFRIRVVNSHNDNQDYYYVKKADASRVYGLEIEHLLSPYRIHYLTHGNTLIEEHIVGVPGDVFIRDWLDGPHVNGVRLAKELVKFNERCFIQLLGDMRSYNFVVNVTPDIEESQIRIRAMDFDQQSYQGRKNFYLPQFFRENASLLKHCMDMIDVTTVYQYRVEELAMMQRRIELVDERLEDLLIAMRSADLAPKEHVLTLRDSLAEHYEEAAFLRANSMGDLVTESISMIQEQLRSVEDENLLIPYGDL
ncbi:MAG: hypothetical protein HRU10_04720 [Opitutales bacterium]|nr:hypothetical protein [Opitutales bacterium]